MSYILDALKKSEQLRNQQNPRMVFAVQTAGVNDDSERNQYGWKYFVLFSIIIAIGIVSYWFYNRTAVPPPPAINEPHTLHLKADEILPNISESTPASTVQIVETPITLTKKDTIKEANPAPIVARIKSPAPAQDISKRVNDVKPNETSVAKNQNNLDDSSLPKIVIAMHMYSDTPANRLVQINDKALKEGDEVEKGLKLVKITPTGVTLNYRGVSFDRTMGPNSLNH